jgi:hypothetical protein
VLVSDLEEGLPMNFIGGFGGAVIVDCTTDAGTR